MADYVPGNPLWRGKAPLLLASKSAARRALLEAARRGLADDRLALWTYPPEKVTPYFDVAIIAGSIDRAIRAQLGGNKALNTLEAQEAAAKLRTATRFLTGGRRGECPCRGGCG